MRGLITSRDVLLHPLLILRCFGAGCLLRCLGAMLSRKTTTFLDLALRR